MPELSRLCNTLKIATSRRFRHVAFPYGDLYYDLLVQLYRYGFLTSVSFGSRDQPYWLDKQLKLANGVEPRTQIVERINPLMLWVELKYIKGTPAFTEMCLVSKPSRPVFVKSDEIYEILLGKSKRFPIVMKPGQALFIRTKYGIKELSSAARDNLNGEILIRVS